MIFLLTFSPRQLERVKIQSWAGLVKWSYCNDSYGRGGEGASGVGTWEVIACALHSYKQQQTEQGDSPDL